MNPLHRSLQRLSSVSPSPTSTLFHHLCGMAEWQPSVGPVHSTRDRDMRLTGFSEFGDNGRADTALRGYTRGSGVLWHPLLLSSLRFHSSQPPAHPLWHWALTCLRPEPLPAPLRQQLLPQPREGSMTAGTRVSRAHLHSVPCPWLHACGSVPC